MAFGHADYNALLSSTLANYRDTFEDNISTSVATYWMLNESGSVEKKDGGESIVVQLMGGTNTTSGSFSGYDPLSLTPQEGLTAANFTWRSHNVSVAISGDEEAKNNGAAKIVDLWKAKIKQAELSAIEDFDDWFSKETAAGNGGKDFDGLNVIIGDNSSTVTTVGGIDSTDADNDWWRSYVNRTAGAITLDDVHNAFYRASRGTAKPKFGLTTLDLYAAVEAQILPQQRFQDPKMAAVGFDNISVKGARVTWGSSVPTGFYTWVNPDYVKLVQHSDFWLSQTPVDKPSGIDARYCHIISRGNLVTSNRALAGSRLESRTA